MTISRLFGISTVLLVGLGGAWVLVPELMLAGWGATADPIAVYMSRRYAVGFFGYAAILWWSRSAPPSPTRRAIVGGTFLTNSLMAGMSLAGVATETISLAGLLPLAVESLLAVAFGRAFVADRLADQPRVGP